MLHAYATQVSSQEPPLLAALRKETCAQIRGAQMLSSPLQGRILAFLSTLVAPATILEIGTYTGYSALCLSEGLRAGGRLHTIERDGRCAELSARYFQRADKKETITSHVGLAAEVIPTIQGKFDLVFIDADKRGYAHYFDLLIDRVPKGGLIIADNVLWKGKVLSQEGREADPRAEALALFATKVQADRRVESLCLPIGDGLLCLSKK